jgi:hypothetical protein
MKLSQKGAQKVLQGRSEFKNRLKSCLVRASDLCPGMRIQVPNISSENLDFFSLESLLDTKSMSNIARESIDELIRECLRSKDKSYIRDFKVRMVRVPQNAIGQELNQFMRDNQLGFLTDMETMFLLAFYNVPKDGPYREQIVYIASHFNDVLGYAWHEGEWQIWKLSSGINSRYCIFKDLQENP